MVFNQGNVSTLKLPARRSAVFLRKGRLQKNQCAKVIRFSIYSARHTLPTPQWRPTRQ